MTETWNTNKPLVTNVVSEDIADINENLTYLMARNGYLVDNTESDQGAAGSGGSVKDYVDAIGTTKKATLFFPHLAIDGNTTVYTFSTDETIPSNINIVIQNGALLTDDASNATLTINGNVEAGIYQIFDWGTGSGALVVGGGGSERPAAWFGFLTSASAAVNAAKIMQAHDSFAGSLGGSILLHRGSFSVASDVIQVKNKNIEFRGVGTGYAYEAGEGGTSLTFGAGTYGFDLAVTQNAGYYCTIRNMRIIGSAAVSYGIATYGPQIIEDVEVTGFNLAGIIVLQMGNQVHIRRVSSSYNVGTGLIIDDSGGNTTTLSIADSNFRRNAVGVQIYNGINISFRNCVIESNYGLGLEIYATDTKAIAYVLFEDVWFESNDDTAPRTGYQVKIWAATADSLTLVPGAIDFVRCSIVSTVSKKHIHLASIRYANFKDCRITGGDTTNGILLTNYASYVNFIDGNVITPSGGTYGNRGGYFNKKTAGSSGYLTNMDVHASGGRTQTLWFTNVIPLVAGNTETLLPMHALSADVPGYPVYGTGSIVGIIVSKRTAPTTGSLVFTPYYRVHWAGSAFDYATTATLAVNTTHVEAVATIEADTFADMDTTANEKMIGIRVVVSDPYTEVTDSKLVVGLVIEY